MPLTHTKACDSARAARTRAQEKWAAKWPKHCKGCLARTDCENPCLRCLYQLTCPRCGTENAMDPEDAALPCTSCGWVDGGHRTDRDDGPIPGNSMPFDFQCRCRVFQAEESAAQEQDLLRQRREIDLQIAELQRRRP